MPRLIFECEEPIAFYDDSGNVIAETTGELVISLSSKSASPIIRKLLKQLTGKKRGKQCAIL